MKKELIAKEHIINNSKYNFIFLHGWGVTYKTLLYFSSLWENKYSIYLLSLPGFFNNELKTSYFLEDYLNDIDEFIREKNLKNVVIIGHSFGGKLAIFLKKKNPSYKIIALAPSIVKNPFNPLTFFKIKMYKFLKKCKCPLHKLFRGSKDYRNTDGYLKKTFINIVHAYMSEEDLQEIGSFLLIGFDKDKEVNIRSLKKVAKLNSNIHFKIFKGDHFSYFDHRYEIYLLINDFIKDNKI